MPANDRAAALQGILLARMAEAVLRCLGGTDARIIRVAGSSGTEEQRQLGIAVPVHREVVISPVAFQSVRKNTAASSIEALLPAAAVLKEAELEGEEDGARWLLAACGIEYCGVTLRVTEVKTEAFSGIPYLYRVIAEE